MSTSFEGCTCVLVPRKRKLEGAARPYSHSSPSLCRLREDASTLRSGWDAQVAQLSKDIISRDLQIQSLQEEAGELKAHLARCQQDVGR